MFYNSEVLRDSIDRFDIDYKRFGTLLFLFQLLRTKFEVIVDLFALTWTFQGNIFEIIQIQFYSSYVWLLTCYAKLCHLNIPEKNSLYYPQTRDRK